MDTVILAKNVELKGGLGLNRPNDNQIVFGSTGSGKSLSIIVPTMCHMTDSSFIGTYAKPALVAKSVRYFQKRGYKTYVWNLANPKEGDPLPDPYAYISSYDDMQELAHQIVYCNPQSLTSSKIDPYWQEASEGLLTGLMDYVLRNEDHVSMKKVIDMFYSLRIYESGKGIWTSLDDEIDDLARRFPDSIAARKLLSFTQLPYVTASCVRDALEKALQHAFPLSVQSSMSIKDSVNFSEVGTQRTAIFIITSPVRVTQYAFSNLLFSIAIRELIEYSESCPDNRLPRNVKLIFDDFSCGFSIQNYEKTISTFRAAGISAIMLCQSLSQLDATYGREGSTTILDNCSSLIYLPGGMNELTCSYISRILNLPLEDVMFMPIGNVVVMQSGKKPIIAPRYDTLSDPLYKELISSDESRSEHMAG